MKYAILFSIVFWLLVVGVFKGIAQGKTWNPITASYSSDQELIDSICASERYQDAPLCN